MMYRAITNDTFHHFIYLLIIFVEVLITILCFIGSCDLYRHLNSPSAEFHHAKRYAIAGLLIGLLLWFLGFQVIAAEWFGMWMSKTWDGTSSATRISLYIISCLIFISIKNDD